jgi:hypothetical protein
MAAGASKFRQIYVPLDLARLNMLPRITETYGPNVNKGSWGTEGMKGGWMVREGKRPDLTTVTVPPRSNEILLYSRIQPRSSSMATENKA